MAIACGGTRVRRSPVSRPRRTSSLGGRGAQATIVAVAVLLTWPFSERVVGRAPASPTGILRLTILDHESGSASEVSPRRRWGMLASDTDTADSCVSSPGRGLLGPLQKRCAPEALEALRESCGANDVETMAQCLDRRIACRACLTIGVPRARGSTAIAWMTASSTAAAPNDVAPSPPAGTSTAVLYRRPGWRRMEGDFLHEE